MKVPLDPGRDLSANLNGPPDGPLVIFAHGSGSSRHSPRNRRVAETLNDQGLRTLLLDLLTPGEEKRDVVTAEHRFDIELLGDRVGHAVDWASNELDPPAIGIFGASTGAAAALVATAARPALVGAVVSRGGRPDLALGALDAVSAPTLLLVGSLDTPVIEFNRQALARLTNGRLQIVEGATHLFEEPGALDEVASLATDWFLRYLSGHQDG